MTSEGHNRHLKFANKDKYDNGFQVYLSKFLCHDFIKQWYVDVYVIYIYIEWLVF